MINDPLIRPCLLGGWALGGGVPLDSQEINHGSTEKWGRLQDEFPFNSWGNFPLNHDSGRKMEKGCMA